MTDLRHQVDKSGAEFMSLAREFKVKFRQQIKKLHAKEEEDRLQEANRKQALIDAEKHRIEMDAKIAAIAEQEEKERKAKDAERIRKKAERKLKKSKE
jgi:hypothetical protein